MSDDPILQALMRLEQAVAAIQRDVATREDLTAIRRDMATRDDLTAARREMATRDDLTALRVAVMDRIDRVQDTLTAIRDDVGVAMGSADAMQRANDNTRELVRIQGEQMTIFFRKLQRLEEQVRALRGDP